MTKVGLLATAVLLAMTATTFAASYTSGTYSAGRPGVHTRGVAIIVSQGSFAVTKASVVERCVAGTNTFTDHYHWISGRHFHLSGTINGSGRFSGRWSSQAARVKVSGVVSDSRASVTVTEKSTYQPTENSAVYSCNGSETFRAKLTKPSSSPKIGVPDVESGPYRP
jgi:hypothetical protein